MNKSVNSGLSRGAETELRQNYARALLIKDYMQNPKKVHDQLIQAGIPLVDKKTTSQYILLMLRHLKPEGINKMLEMTGKSQLVQNADYSTMTSSFPAVNATLSSKKIESFDLSAIEHMSSDNNSMKGSVKSVKNAHLEGILEESKSEGGAKSNHHYAVDAINAVLSNEAVLHKVPYLKTINQLEKSGKITREQANIERAESIRDSMKSNKTTQAIVQEAIHESTRNLIRLQKPNPLDTTQHRKLKVTQINNLGQYGFTDPDVDETRRIGQRFRPEEEIKSDRQFDSQVLGDLSSNDNQTGVMNEMPNSRRQGADFTRFAKEKSHIIDDLTAKMIEIKHKSGISEKAKEASTRILRKIHHADQSAFEAEADLQHPDKSSFNNNGKSEVVVDDTSNLSAFPKGGANIPRSLEDVLQSQAWGQLVGDQLGKKELTGDQSEYAKKVLFDADSFLVNFPDYSSSSSAKGSKLSRSSKWSKQAQNDIVSEIMRQVKDNNGNYGQLDSLKLVDKEGKPISLSDVINMIPKVVDSVSKIQGDIELNKKLSDYKKQTEVFATKVVKQETNKFAVATGSAFRMRACC